MKRGAWLSRYWLLWLLVALGLGTLLLRGLAQAYLAAPAAQALGRLRLLYLSIPQSGLWMVFLLLAYLLFAASLPRPLREPPWQYQELVLGAERPLKRLAYWIGRSDSAYARYRVCQAVAEVAVKLLASRRECSPHQVKSMILQGSLELPEDVASYLNEGLKVNHRVIEAGPPRWSGVSAAPRVDPRLIATLEFLEVEAIYGTK